jgi:hypothetical protein
MVRMVGRVVWIRKCIGILRLQGSRRGNCPPLSPGDGGGAKKRSKSGVRKT